MRARAPRRVRGSAARGTRLLRAGERSHARQPCSPTAGPARGASGGAVADVPRRAASGCTRDHAERRSSRLGARGRLLTCVGGPAGGAGAARAARLLGAVDGDAGGARARPGAGRARPCRCDARPGGRPSSASRDWRPSVAAGREALSLDEAVVRSFADARAARRHGHLPLHGHRGLDAAAARARRRGLRGGAGRAPARPARRVRAPRRRRGRHAGRRVLRRVRRRARRAARRRPRRRRRSATGRSGCGWASTPATPHVTEEGTSASTSTGRRGSLPPATAARCSSRRTTAALVDDGRLRDLGEHRLKDLTAPERIFQLGEGEFPPLETLYRTNLPMPATPFLGRERELAEVGELLLGARTCAC